jgi:hypothetical protein
MVPVQADTSSSKTEALFPYYDSAKGKFGYINKSGKVVVKAKYDAAEEFSEGLAVVGKKDSYGDMAYGYIDTTGKVAIKLKYGEAKNFSEGYAAVRKGNEGWGFINTKGKFVIKPSTDYVRVGNFSDGLVWEEGYGFNYDYVDANGQKVFSLGFDNYIGNDWDKGFYEIRDFNGGLAIAATGGARISREDSLYPACVIDKSGEIVINAKENGYMIVGGFHDGLARVKKDGKYGYINTKGKLVIDAVYDVAGDFSDGRASVGKTGFGASGNHTQYGYIDKKGNTIVKLKYDSAESFSDGLAKVGKDGKYGYINKKGKVVNK